MLCIGFVALITVLHFLRLVNDAVSKTTHAEVGNAYYIPDFLCDLVRCSLVAELAMDRLAILVLSGGTIGPSKRSTFIS